MKDIHHFHSYSFDFTQHVITHAEEKEKEFIGEVLPVSLLKEDPLETSSLASLPPLQRYTMTTLLPSMNSMMDTITDAEETAMICGYHAGGLRHHMLQGAVRCALRDIHHQAPPRRFLVMRTGVRGAHHSRPRPESPLLFAPGICPGRDGELEVNLLMGRGKRIFWGGF